MLELEFLHGDHYPRCTAVVDKRFAGYYSLQMMTRGGIDLRYDQEQYRLAGRWVFVSYPGPFVHFERSPGRSHWDHRYVAFRGHLAIHWHEQGLLPFAPQPVPEQSDFVARFDRLLHLFQRQDRLGHYRVANLLEGLLLELADHRRPANVQWLDRAKERVLQSEAFQPDYSRIAEGFGMALSTFRRTFRKEAGMSVHQFLLRSRVDAATHLLAETQVPVKAIAAQLGYRDVYFFSRQFAQIAGQSPATYRKAAANQGSEAKKRFQRGL